MSANTRKLLERVETWPEEDQRELVEAALEIEERRRGVYQPSAEELVGVDRGLAAARQGLFASGEEMAALRKKFRNV